MTETGNTERLPVQAPRGGFARSLGGTIPRALGEAAWQGYAEDGHSSQSCERLHERGGFGLSELGYYLARAVESGRVQVQIVRPHRATPALHTQASDEGKPMG